MTHRHEMLIAYLPYMVGSVSLTRQQKMKCFHLILNLYFFCHIKRPISQKISVLELHQDHHFLNHHFEVQLLCILRVQLAIIYCSKL